MGLLTGNDKLFVQSVSQLVYCNPFLPERIEHERAALGDEFHADGTLWHTRLDPSPTPNIHRLHQRAEAIAERVHTRLADGVRPGADEAAAYEDLVAYLLFQKYEGHFFRLIETPRTATARIDFYRPFAADAQRYLTGPPGTFPSRDEIPHLFACCFQVRRAFHHIFQNILGGSTPAVRLRAAVWQSIFTRDPRRYRRTLYQRMSDVATLISGPSGTGKELVAQAIGYSRYVPFDPARSVFVQDFLGSFYALNPSALAPTLIESELFGHRRGAFTGALQDRSGWLEVCPPLGTVFLDEIGDLDASIQVKLLRVLQTRVFQRLGDTENRRFQGKVIAATHRDLDAEMRAGRFREDFYYRLCSDLVETPTLAEQLREAPDELRTLARAIARRVAGEVEADGLAEETVAWIDKHLGRAYQWPGNVRELEQCVRNVMIRGEYRPPRARDAVDPTGGLVAPMLAGTLTAEELLRRYCTHVYTQTGSYQAAARQLGLDRRTVREKIEAARREGRHRDAGSGSDD